MCSLSTDADGIVEMDFLLKKKADLNLEESELRMLNVPNHAHGFVSQRLAVAQGRPYEIAALRQF